MSSKDVCKFINISRPRLRELIDDYNLPNVSLSCGMVFLKSDIETFQKNRQHKLKHRRKRKN
ncbi:hypothetical protein [Kordia sp.]|uniref:hypothetical protein n=1 Tax=Kordia sp. TaxID=1965332 RepID=UPI003D6B4682